MAIVIQESHMGLRRSAFEMEGLHLAVESDSPVVHEHLGLVFECFSADPVLDDVVYRVLVSSSGSLVVIPDTVPLTFPTELQAAEYVQWHISQRVLSTVNTRFALHAAALLPPGERETILLVGPSGAGKTTLTLSLADRGFGFLTDEAVFLSFHEPMVEGFPRAPGERRQGSDGCKVYRSPTRVGSHLIRTALPVNTILLLDGFADRPALRPETPASAVAALVRQVYAIEPVESILEALVRLASSANSFRLRAGTPESTAALIADLASSRRAA